MLGEENVAKAWPVTILLLIYCGSMSKGPSSGEIIAKKKRESHFNRGWGADGRPESVWDQEMAAPRATSQAGQEARGCLLFFFFFLSKSYSRKLWAHESLSGIPLFNPNVLLSSSVKMCCSPCRHRCARERRPGCVGLQVGTHPSFTGGPGPALGEHGLFVLAGPPAGKAKPAWPLQSNAAPPRPRSGTAARSPGGRPRMFPLRRGFARAALAGGILRVCLTWSLL